MKYYTWGMTLAGEWEAIRTEVAFLLFLGLTVGENRKLTIM